ncbi:MAG TPA: hypothetical protein DIT13_04785 [Verrucomicrobiales bacterium]|nr:hypothetical protein [Verrucomicrobiales bacterium]HRJ10575.1 histidine kinase [Prosthecobacter sp.]HRK14347.1 histidine kinase [Prosthecobacter sp.]
MRRALTSLQFKVSASIFLMGAVLITLSAARMTSRAIESRHARVVAHASMEGGRLAGMAQHLIRRQAPHVMDLELSYASAQQDLELGLILDDTGRVRLSTRQDLRGLPLAETPMAEAAELVDQARFSMEGRVVEAEAGTKMRAVFPFREGLNERRGCVLLDFDLERPLDEGMAAALHSSMVQGLALAGGCLVLWLLLKVVVTERVSMLVRQVEDISLESDPGAPLEGADEISRVSQAASRTHARLRQSEQRLRQVAATMRDVFWLAPAEAAQEPYVNPAYQSVLKRDPARLAARRWDWLHALAREDRRPCLERLRRLRSGEVVPEFEARVVSSPGQTIWLRCRGFSVPGHAGAGRMVGGIAMDVSERKMLDRRLLDTAEKERQRVGVDLHDDLCQRLAAVLMKTGILQAALERAESPQQALAAELARDLSEATALSRRFARGLAPVSIEALGLPAALADLGDFISRAFNIPCRVECTGAELNCGAETATHIFRVAQELANNAAKHGGCSWIEIAFEAAAHEARLRIRHDGRPYDPQHSQGDGMGMHLVRQRLDALGASLGVICDEESGVVQECRISLNDTPNTPTS